MQYIVRDTFLRNVAVYHLTRRHALTDSKLYTRPLHNIKSHIKKCVFTFFTWFYIVCTKQIWYRLYFLCLSFIWNSCPSVIEYPWGLLPGKPINKCFPSWLHRLCVSTRHSNYRYCYIATCSTKICAILLYWPFVVIHHNVCFVMQMHCCSRINMYCESPFRGLCYAKVIYTELSYWKEKHICQCQAVITLADWHGQLVVHWQITPKFAIEYWSWLVNRLEFVCQRRRLRSGKKTKL